MNQYVWYVIAILLCLSVTDVRTEGGESRLILFGHKHRKTARPAVGSQAGAAPECPTDFFKVGTNCYYFSDQSATWFQSVQACRDMGANLAHPGNAEENTALKNYIRDNYGGTPEAWWIGGTDAATENTWLWSHDNNGIVYTDWCPDTYEPNNYGDEDHLSFNSLCDFRWNDRAGTFDQFGYICQA